MTKMFLSTRRLLPTFNFGQTVLDSLWDEDDDFNYPLTAFIKPKKSITKEKKLKRKLKSLQTKEDEVLHQIKTYESEIEQLKKTRQHIESEQTEITEQINKIQEEKNMNKERSDSKNEQKKTLNDSYVFKRVHYKTNDMEIEEQYDSKNPKNCYKIIRKQGEAPQILPSEERKQISTGKESNNEQEKNKEEKNSEVNEKKYEQFCNMIGKKSEEIKQLIDENSNLTIGQLYDKAIQNKLI